MKNMKLAMLAMGLMVSSVGMAMTPLAMVLAMGSVGMAMIPTPEERRLKEHRLEERRLEEERDKLHVAATCFFVGAAMLPMPGSALMGSIPLISGVLSKSFIERAVADAFFEEDLANDFEFESKIKARKKERDFEKNIFDAAQF